jgi:hypothetical protein
LGFDGIAYGSSRNNDGTNYSLFNDDVCKFIRSEIYSVKGIEIKSKKVLPINNI